MVNKHGGKGCNNSYTSNKINNHSQIDLFKFQEGTEGSQIWGSNAPREVWLPPQNSMFCGNRFFEDTISSRKSMDEEDFEVQYAVPDALPQYPGNIGSYEMGRMSRISSDSSIGIRGGRTENALLRDRYYSLQDLDIRVNDIVYNVESQLSIVKRSDARIFIAVTSNEPPKIKYSLKIDDNLNYQIWCEDNLVTYTDNTYTSLNPNKKLDSCACVINVLKYAEELYQCKKEEQNEENDMILDLIKKYEKRMLSNNKKASFITEQLSLLFTPTNSRQFSASTLALAVTWEQTSPVAYKQILNDNILTLPSVKAVRTMSSEVTLDPGLNESAEASLWCEESQRIYSDISVSLAMGELYFQQNAHRDDKQSYDVNENQVNISFFNNN